VEDKEEWKGAPVACAQDPAALAQEGLAEAGVLWPRYAVDVPRSRKPWMTLSRRTSGRERQATVNVRIAGNPGRCLGDHFSLLLAGAGNVEALTTAASTPPGAAGCRGAGLPGRGPWQDCVCTTTRPNPKQAEGGTFNGVWRLWP